MGKGSKKTTYFYFFTITLKFNNLYSSTDYLICQYEMTRKRP